MLPLLFGSNILKESRLVGKSKSQPIGSKDASATIWFKYTQRIMTCWEKQTTTYRKQGCFRYYLVQISSKNPDLWEKANHNLSEARMLPLLFGSNILKESRCIRKSGSFFSGNFQPLKMCFIWGQSTIHLPVRYWISWKSNISKM